MTNEEFLLNIEKTFTNALELVRRKNSDYATNENPFKNFNSAEVAGVSSARAILIRILDKLSRVSNCLDKPSTEVKDETIEDTLLDMINYAAILKAYLNDKRKT